MLTSVWIAYKTWEYFHPFTAMPLVRPWYYVWPESQSFKRDVQKCKRVHSILSDTWKNIMEGLWSPSADREGIALQEISNLPQHKYRLDPRGKKNSWLWGLWDAESVFKAGYEFSITADFLRIGEILFRVCWKAGSWGMYIISSGFPSVGVVGGGGMWQQYPWGLPWTYAFHSSPLPDYVTG